jgi:hypothetical protein
VLLVRERSAARRLDRTGGDDGGSQFSVGMGLALGALFCTVAGYFALLPLMHAARSGAGSWSFAQLHAVSAGFFLIKLMLVALLAWRASAAGGDPLAAVPASRDRL